MTGVGEKLRDYRAKHSQTQTELAQKLGVTKSHISDVELRRRMVSVARADLWARTLGLRQAEMVEASIQDKLDRAGLPLRARIFEKAS